MRERTIQKGFAALLAAGFISASSLCGISGTWAITQRIPLGTNVVRILPDPYRPRLYAIDRENSDIFFVDLLTASVQKKLYVGKDPTDLDIDITGNFLYVANKGPGTGVPGSWRIGVIALTNQTLVTSYITPVVAVNVTAGRAGRLYYNSGYDLWNGGDAHSINTDTGTDLGTFSAVKTRMVILSNKTRLFGQYIYYGNLGAMADFGVSNDQITVVDSLNYSPYPYGWDYDNYSLSGDDRRLAYGRILFNPTNFMDQIGQFAEQVYALNRDGSVAFGQASIWDTTTFPIHGDATRLANMPFATTIMAFDSQRNVLYAFNNSDSSLYIIEQTTTHGVPLRWLGTYGLGTDDVVESQDVDGDGLSTLQEWIVDSDPTNATPALQLEWTSGPDLKVQNTSYARWYELQRRTDLTTGNWQVVLQQKGSGSYLVFANLTPYAKAFYRVRVKPY
jgi:hypothetical protein